MWRGDAITVAKVLTGEAQDEACVQATKVGSAGSEARARNLTKAERSNATEVAGISGRGTKDEVNGG